MDRRQFLATLSLAGLGVVSLGSCVKREPLLRVSGIVWVGYEPLFLARTLGYYDPLQIRLVESPSNTNSLMALATGEVDAATLTLDECLLALSGGIDVQVIAVFDTSNGADVVMARPDIHDLGQLAGKRIGVEETAAGALMLSKTLDAAKLAPEDVIKVPVTGDQQLGYYEAGKVDALISYEPFASQLAAKGARRLYDSSSFPGVIVDVLVARVEALKRQPVAFRQLLKGYFRAVSYLTDKPADAYKKMAPRMQIPPEQVAKAFEGIHVLSLVENHHWLDGASPELVHAAHTVAQIMYDNRLLRRKPVYTDMTNPSFLPVSS